MSDRLTTAQPVMARAFHEVRELIAERRAKLLAENELGAGYDQALLDLDQDISELLRRSKLPDYILKPCCTEREHEALAAYREAVAELARLHCQPPPRCARTAGADQARESREWAERLEAIGAAINRVCRVEGMVD